MTDQEIPKKIGIFGIKLITSVDNPNVAISGIPTKVAKSDMKI